MAIKIQFDQARTPETPTLVLAKRNGDKIGQINATNISLTDFYNDASEIQFDVHKDMNTFEEPPSGEKYNDSAYASVFTLGRSILGNTENSFTWDAPNIWEELVDLRLVWCKEWDMWFQITVSVSETDDLVKTVSCVELGPAELSQIMLYNIEINTETDISRDDYTEPTVFWNPTHPEASLLHRLMENVPHYTIQYVEGTIENIQRTFTFDSESIYDAFQEIAEEIGCIFIFHSGSDSDGNIQRSISVYDLYSNCIDCGYRGEFTDQCPECGGTDINEGYGEDTTIFITSDSLSDEIDYATNVSDIKNCFKLEAGDDLMTATVRNCNPNGSDRIWRWNSNMVADMTEDLVNKLNEYNELYDYYQNEYQIKRLTQEVCDAYNEVVKTYRSYDPSLGTIDYPVIGYPALMEAYYNTIDLVLYLQSGLMPSVSLSDTTAQEQAGLLIRRSLSPVAVSNINTVSLATANSAVLAVAKCIVRNTYQVKVNESSLSGTTWTGTFIVTNYSDEEDTAVSDPVTVDISDDYETYLKQCIQKTINSEDGEDYSITSLFDKSYDGFCIALKEYCLDWLNTFRDACQACLNILIEQGIADRETWSQGDPNLYDDLYLPYYEKFCAIEAEMKVREDEINTITGVTDEDGDITLYGTQTYIEEENAEIQDILDFEKYLGEDLWKELSAFRREDKFTNSNYISDGLNNAEIFTKAQEFIEVAKVELYKSSELQHSITATLNNLLAIDAFAPLVDYFEVGNWLRIRVDERVYKLRLVSYGIDYEDLSTLTIEFSDVIKIPGGMSDVQSIMNRASSISSSYGYTQHQADQGASGRRTVQNWVTNGLDLTNMRIISSADNQDQYWDEYGILLRKYNSITDMYEDTQMKIVNSTIAITDDAWRTIRTAVGNFYYVDPNTGEIVSAYGVNAETLVGKVILGEGLGIYTTDGSLTFDENGLVIDTSSGIAFTIENNGEKQLYIDSYGNLVMDNGAHIVWGNIDLTDIILSVDQIWTYDDDGNRTDLMAYIHAEYGYIVDLTVENLDALYGYIKELESEYIKVGVIEGEYGNFEILNVEDLFAASLEAIEAEIGKLSAIYATIDALDVISETVVNLNAWSATISSLLTGNEVAGEITTIVLTANNVTIGEGFIEKLVADTILADLIKANYIDTEVITIQSGEEGGITIIGNQMQFTNGQIIFYDDDGNPRLQIGQDATGNFTFELYAADGSGVMIDQDGIHASAISDGLIVDAMVADDAAIQGSKLDIASVASCLNADGSLIMNASSVYLGEEGLDIYLTELQRQIDSLDPSEYERYGIESVVSWFCIGDNNEEPPYTPDDDRAYANIFALGKSILGKTKLAEDPNLLYYYDGIDPDTEVGATVIDFELNERGKKYMSNHTATFSFEFKSTVGDTIIITYNLDGNEFKEEISDSSGEWIEYSRTFDVGELTEEPYINIDGATDRRLRDYLFRNFYLISDGCPTDGWTTNRLEALDGEYLWWVEEYICYDGTIIWGTPVCLTDGYIRTTTTTLIGRVTATEEYFEYLYGRVNDTDTILTKYGDEITSIEDYYNWFYADYQEQISIISHNVATTDGVVTDLQTSVSEVVQTVDSWSTFIEDAETILYPGFEYFYDQIGILQITTEEFTAGLVRVEGLIEDLDFDGLSDFQAYYILSDDPENAPDTPRYDDRAYAQIFALGVSVLGNETNSCEWTTEKLTGAEGINLLSLYENKDIDADADVDASGDGKYLYLNAYGTQYIVGHTVTFSFEAKWDGTGSCFVRMNNTNLSRPAASANFTDITTEWRTYTLTFSVNSLVDDPLDSDKPYIYIYDAYGNTQIRHIKLELGSEATDFNTGTSLRYVWMSWRKIHTDGTVTWSEPELLTDAYTNVQWSYIHETLGSITLEVGGLVEGYDELYYSVSQIEMTVESLKLSLTYNGDRAYISLVSDGSEILQSDVSIAKGIQAAALDNNGTGIVISAGTVVMESNTLQVVSDQFRLDSLGDAWFSGTLSAPRGCIGAWIIDDTSIWSAQGWLGYNFDDGTLGTNYWMVRLNSPDTKNDSTHVIETVHVQFTQVDTENNNILYNFTDGPTFYVTYSGFLYAQEAEITGTIHATDGEFRGTVYATDGEFRGAVYADSGYFYGEIQASSGKIGNWRINSSGLYYGSTISVTPDEIVYGKNFTVTSAGNMTAVDAVLTNATVSGTVTTTNGNYTTVLNGGYMSIQYGGTERGQFRGTQWVNTSWYGIEMGLAESADFMSFGRWSSSLGYYDAAYVINYNMTTSGYSGYRHVFIGAVNIWNNLTVGGSINGYDIASIASTANSALSTANTASSTASTAASNVSSLQTTVSNIQSTINSGTVNSASYATSAGSVSGSLTVKLRYNNSDIDSEGAWNGSSSTTMDLDIDSLFTKNITMTGTLTVTSGDGVRVKNTWSDGSTLTLAFSANGTGTGTDDKAVGLVDATDSNNGDFIFWEWHDGSVGINAPSNDGIYIGAHTGAETPVYIGNVSGKTRIKGQSVSIVGESSYTIWLGASTAPSGGIGIGTTSKYTYIYGNLYLMRDSDSNYVYVGNNSRRFLATSGNYIGLGNQDSPSTVNLYFWSNDMYMSTTPSYGSDRSLKDDIVQLDKDEDTEEEIVSEIDKLEPVSFRYKNSDDESVHYGYVADDVQEVLPDIVTVNGMDGTLGLRYLDIIALLHVKVKSQDTEIAELKDRIAELESALPKSK